MESDKEIHSFSSILKEKFIKNFSEEGDIEFSKIKCFEDCLAWQLKYTSYFSKEICEELALLNWQRINENNDKLKNKTILKSQPEKIDEILE